MKPVHLVWTVPLIGLLALHFASERHHESELAELRSEVRAVSTPGESRRQLEAQRETRRSAPAPAPAALQQIPEEPARAAPSPSQSSPDVVKVRDQLEQFFTKQQADVRWSGDARRTAEARLSKILPETSKLQSLECRASMCRIETVHQELMSYQAFVQDAFMNAQTKLWNGGFFSTQLAEPVEGKLVTVAYLAREGEELPLVTE